MKKKFLSLILAMVMVLCVLPVGAYAGSVEPQAQFKLASSGATFTDLEDAVAAATDTDTIKLIAKEIELGRTEITGKAITLEADFGDVTIKLNGPMMFGDNGECGVYTLSAIHGAKLKIEEQLSNSRAIAIRRDNTLNIKGDVEIAGATEAAIDTPSYDGGLIIVNQGSTLNMYGGKLSGGYTYGKGGAVYVVSGAAFNMYDGKIKDCVATYGGAVLAETGSIFNMSGGKISDCESAAGGAVYVGGDFNLKGGLISNCTAQAINSDGNVGKGGAVYILAGYGQMNMTGGMIINNYADYKGGAIYVGIAKSIGTEPREAWLSLSGGEIIGNTAPTGAGVYVYYKDTEEEGCIPAANVYVQGSPVVAGNRSTATGAALEAMNLSTKAALDNIHLANGTKLVVTGSGLKLGANLFVNAEDDEEYTLIAKGATANTDVASAALFIHSDNELFEFGFNDNDYSKLVVLAPRRYMLASSGKMYSDFNAAIAAAKNTDTIKLIAKEIELGRTEITGKSITLEADLLDVTLKMNGPMMFGENDHNEVYTLKAAAGGKLKLKWESAESRPIAIRKGNTLNIKGDVEIVGATAAAMDTPSYDGGLIIVNQGATLNMYDGKLCNGKTTGNGGAVYVVSGAAFNMYDGTIKDCVATYGGAVLAATGSIFNMFGGKISGCQSAAGGAVYVSGNFNLKGGVISDCRAYTTEFDGKGGAVYILAGYGQMEMSGGKIVNNYANYKGGAVYVGIAKSQDTEPREAWLKLSGGEISGNNAPIIGAGVYAYYRDYENGSCIPAANVYVQGSPVVKNNINDLKQYDDLHLASGTAVTITGNGLKLGADIGLCCEKDVDGAVIVKKNGQITAFEKSYFKLEGANNTLKYTADKNALLLVDVKCEHHGELTMKELSDQIFEADDVELFVNRMNFGSYNIKSVREGGKVVGWSLQVAGGTRAGKYLAEVNGKLKFTDTPFAWEYKNGGFCATEVETSTAMGYTLFGKRIEPATVRRTKTYYLSTISEGASLSKIFYVAQMYLEKEYDDHVWKYTQLGDGTHAVFCTRCLEYEVEKCVYDFATGRCECGQYDHTRVSGRMNETEKQIKDVFGKTYVIKSTKFSAQLNVSAGTKPTYKVLAYSLNGGKLWMLGDTAVSEKTIDDALLKVCDNEGNTFVVEAYVN